MKVLNWRSRKPVGGRDRNQAEADGGNWWTPILWHIMMHFPLTVFGNLKRTPDSIAAAIARLLDCLARQRTALGRPAQLDVQK